MPGLRGWLGQALTREKRPEVLSYVTLFGSGTNTWVCPRSGVYRVVQWGAGGPRGAISGGDGAAHAQTVRRLRLGEKLEISVGQSFETDDGGPTTVNFPDGTIVITTGGGRSNGPVSPGVATGGDINVPGQPRSGLNGGSAGSYGNFKGGVGGSSPLSLQCGGNPGGGAYERGHAGASGAPGLVLLILEAV